jgi:hypothetical protein
VAIIVMSYQGGQSTWLRQGQVDGAELIERVAGIDLRPHHALPVYNALRDHLAVLRKRHPQKVLAALREHGYLGPALQRQLPDDPAYQASLLTHVLRECHGGSLDRDLAVAVIEEAAGPPAPALLAAVSGLLASPADSGDIALAFARSALEYYEQPGDGSGSSAATPKPRVPGSGGPYTRGLRLAPARPGERSRLDKR